MCKLNEITESEKKLMRSMLAQLSQAHGFPKIDKAFTNFPNFRIVIDATNIPYCKTGQYLSLICVI